MRHIVIMAGVLAASLTHGGVSVAQSNGGAAAAQVTQLAEEVRRLNGRIEQLEFRLKQVADDAAKRISDLEFRIIELEGGDPSVLGAAPPLGGSNARAKPAVAISERAALDDAIALVQAGDGRGARDALERFIASDVSGPLAGEAQHWLGEAHFRGGDYRRAAQAYLSHVTGHPSDARAPDSLVRLARSLHRLGKEREACLTFDEVRRRYPNANQAIADADAAKDEFSCG